MRADPSCADEAAKIARQSRLLLGEMVASAQWDDDARAKNVVVLRTIAKQFTDLVAEKAKISCPFAWHYYRSEDDDGDGGAAGNFPRSGATIGSHLVLLPDGLGAYELGGAACKKINPRALFPRNLKGVAAFREYAGRITAMSREVATDVINRDMAVGGLTRKIGCLRGLVSSALLKLEAELGLYTCITDAALSVADSLERALSEFDGVGGVAALSAGEDRVLLEDIYRQSREAVTSLRATPNAEQLGGLPVAHQALDYWHVVRTHAGVLRITKSKIDDMVKQTGQHGVHILRAAAMFPEYPVDAVDVLHATLNCLGKSFSTKVIQLQVVVGTFAAMKEKTLTEPGCKLQIADEDTNPHFGQMWGGEMIKWLGPWQCTAEFLPEPYGTIVSRMCDYASLLRSLYHEGEPAVFHGITVGELNELVHSTVTQFFFHYRRLFPAVKNSKGQWRGRLTRSCHYCIVEVPDAIRLYGTAGDASCDAGEAMHQFVRMCSVDRTSNAGGKASREDRDRQLMEAAVREQALTPMSVFVKNAKKAKRQYEKNSKKYGPLLVERGRAALLADEVCARWLLAERLPEPTHRAIGGGIFVRWRRRRGRRRCRGRRLRLHDHAD